MLDADESRRLKVALARERRATLALVAVAIGVAGLGATLVLGSDVVQPEPAVAAALLGLWWLWLLRKAPPKARRIAADLARGEAATLRGTAAIVAQRGFGLFAPTSHQLVLAGEVCDADGFTVAELRPGEMVRARVGAQSRVLLSVAPSDVAAPAESAVDPDGLTERERELLALIGEGLPDKLIARRLGLAPTTVRTTIRRCSANWASPTAAGRSRTCAAAAFRCQSTSTDIFSLSRRLRALLNSGYLAGDRRHAAYAP